MISLKEYSTFRLPAHATQLTIITTATQLKELIHEQDWNPQNILILWEGSNTLFTQDFSGHILVNRIKGIEIMDDNTTNVRIRIGGGELLHDLVERSITQNYTGLENLILIPGTVGAAPVQNVGAYGTEIKDLVVQIEGINTQTGQYHTYTQSECQFWYRSSIFKHTLKQDFFITNVVLQLNKRDNTYTPLIHYGAIQQELQQQGRDGHALLHPRQVASAISAIRSSKLPNWKEIWTAGSFFQNPIITTKEYQQLLEKTPALIGHPLGESHIKLSAGQLIELCGLKGKTVGDAAVSDKHALVLINHGQATGEQLNELITLITTNVHQKFGIILDAEVNIY